MRGLLQSFKAMPWRIDELCLEARFSVMGGGEE